MADQSGGARIHGRTTRTHACRALLLVLTLALAAGCSSTADSAAEDRQPEDTSTTTTVPMFTGTVEDFYAVPDPLPPGEPGELIRTMPVESPEGEAGLRIMYHSTDAEGDDRAATGTVWAPTGEAPDGGWPILAWAHGTSGLAAACAPSRDPEPPPAFGVEGVLVAADYIGLGPDGEIHPYLTAAGEANAVIDAVAAARAMPELHAGDDWVVAGVSQGGHAALLTGESAAERLPDTNLLGTVAMAPAAQLGETFGDELQTRVIVAMVLVGAAAEDPSIELGDYLNTAALEASAVISEKCVNDVAPAMIPVAGAQDFFSVDPRTAVLGGEWLKANDPGQTASPTPVLLVQGSQDILVLPARTDSFQARLCGLGQVVERIDIPTADHNSVTEEADAQVSAWVAARFAGEPPADSC